MNKRVVHQSATAVAIAAGALIPAGHAMALGLLAQRSDRAAVYSGPTVGMRWGPVRATIRVRQHRIVGVTIDVTGDAVRSHFIERHAVPLLKQETLQAQSMYIDTVSGATQTSQAYIQSLGVALARAYKAKTLPTE